MDKRGVKMDKKQTRKQEFKEEYSRKFPFIKKHDLYNVLCTVCNSTFSIGHSGIYDIKVHVKSQTHSTRGALMEGQQTLDIFRNKNLQSIRAECYMVSYIIEHNLPLLASDHLSDIIKKIVRELTGTNAEFGCKRTKATCITKEMARECKSSLVESLKKTPYFSVSTDGSADTGFKKQLYPVLVRYYNSEMQKIVTEVLDIPKMVVDSTGKNIFDLLDEVLVKNNLTWDKCIAFCSDNANVMMGQKKGVAAFVKERHNNVFINGCPCHLAAIAAKKGAKCLPVNLEDLLIDIMYHMKSSSKRTRQLAELQDYFGLTKNMLLAYASTRWLSMGQCIPRLLELWPALQSFFQNAELALASKSSKRSAGDSEKSNPKKVSYHFF
jgi:hypothetical protein